MPKKPRSKTREARRVEDAPVRISERFAWLLVAIAIVFVGAIRIRLLNTPLERDEGEFAYMGQLMLQGIPPYKLAYNMKFPGIYMAYALVLGIFGQSIAAVHIGLMIANSIAVVLLFLIAKRLFDPLTSAIAAGVFAFLSVGDSVLGTAGHATQYVLPFALGGILMLLKGIESGKPMSFVWSGLLLGIGILMKQHAALFVAFAVLYLIWGQSRAKPARWGRILGNTGIIVGSAVVPFLLTCMWLYLAGVSRNFWFWTFTYAREYVSEIPFRYGMIVFASSVSSLVEDTHWIWVIAGIGLTAIIWSAKARSKWAFILGFTAFSFLAVCPGFFFRCQYWVLFLPAVGLLTGVAVGSATDLLIKSRSGRALEIAPIMILAVAMLLAASEQSAFLFHATPYQACRMTYGANPFPESIAISKYIREHSNKDDLVAVIGSEPQIYFYSRRHSATGYIYMYGLMEQQPYASEMQQNMIREIEASKPRYIVFVNIYISWLVKKHSDTTIVKWTNEYLARHYRTVGLMDMISANETRSYWGKEAAGITPQGYYVCALERKPE